MEELLASVWTDEARGQTQKAIKVHSPYMIYTGWLLATILTNCSYGIGNRTEVSFVKKLRKEQKGKRTTVLHH